MNRRSQPIEAQIAAMVQLGAALGWRAFVILQILLAEEAGALEAGAFGNAVDAQRRIAQQVIGQTEAVGMAELTDVHAGEDSHHCPDVFTLAAELLGDTSCVCIAAGVGLDEGIYVSLPRRMQVPLVGDPLQPPIFVLGAAFSERRYVYFVYRQRLYQRHKRKVLFC